MADTAHVTQGRAWLLPYSQRQSGRDNSKVWKGVIRLLPFCYPEPEYCCHGGTRCPGNDAPGCHLLPARDSLFPRSGAKVGRSRGWICWGSRARAARGARPAPAASCDGGTAAHAHTHRCTYSTCNPPATRIQTTRIHTLQTHTEMRTHIHTEWIAHTDTPKQVGKDIHPGLYGTQAQGRSPTLTDRCLPPQRCPPWPVPLTWAGRRKVGSRRPAGNRAGGAATPPFYRTGQGGTAAGAPGIISVPAYLRLSISSGLEAGVS